jgi:hypothetical protein
MKIIYLTALTCVINACSMPLSISSKDIFFDNHQKGIFRYYEKLVYFPSANLIKTSDSLATIKDNKTNHYYEMVLDFKMDPENNLSIIAIKWHDGKWHDGNAKRKYSYEVLSIEKSKYIISLSVIHIM